MTGDSDTGAESESPGGVSVFTGADRIYRLIGALYQRPRIGDRPRRLTATDTEVTWGDSVDRADRAGCRGLPMVCLVRPAGPSDLLPAIDQLLDGAKRGGVCHAYLDLAEQDSPTTATEWTRADVVSIRELLRGLRNKLVNNTKVRGSRLRFPLFSLVYWLMDKTSDPDDPKPDVTVRRLLQDEGVVRRIGDALQAVDKEFTGGKLRWRAPLWLISLCTLGLFRIALTGRVPVLSGRYRWFMRQPHLAPEMSGTFVRFAERLIGWQNEATEYVARLLVNAFLEDLRRAYRLYPWHIFRARRMTYPVVLLDNITTTNGGYRLLRLINVVRNQVGSFDPLLVVSASGDVPPDAVKPYAERPPVQASKAVEGYISWQHLLLDARRARKPIAWYLPIRVPGGRSTTDAVARMHAFHGFDAGRKPARPPLLSSRWLRIGAVAVVLAGSLTSAFVWYRAHCDSWHPALHLSQG